MLNIYIDADACPVKEEIYRVAARYKLKVLVVSNRPLHTPLHPDIQTKVVGKQLDEADNWIVDNIEEDDILVTSDIPLAHRSLLKNAKVISSKGREWDEDSIGEAMATREVMAYMRELGETTPKHSMFDKKDRSQFLNKLDQVIQRIKK